MIRPMKLSKTICFFLILGLTACKDREILTISELYSFGKLAKIEINPSNLEYKLYVSEPIKFNSTGTDISGKRVSIPDSLITLFVNGQPSKEKELIFQDTGQYQVKVQFGKIESPPKTIQVKDEIAEVEVSYSRPVFYLNEDTEPIDISVVIKNQEGEVYNIKDKSQLKLSVNGQDLNQHTFLPTEVGRYKVQASLKNHKSPISELQSLDAFKVVHSIKVTAHSIGGTHLGIAGKESLYNLKTIVYDKDNKALPLSKSISYYANGELLNQSTFGAKNAGTYQIHAKGYGKTSDLYSIIMREDKIYNQVQIPIILHFIDITPPSDSEIASIMKQVNLDYSGENNSSNPRDPNAVNTYIQFSLATKDPEGKTLERPGLNIVKPGIPLNDKLVTQAIPENPCFQNFWNPNKYLNVWVVNVPDGPWGGLGSGPLSQENFSPGYTPPTLPWFLFGTWINKSLSVGVLVHELGHNLGLAHTFSGNPVYGVISDSDEACKIDIDGCEDTPNYHRTTLNMPSINRISCMGAEFISTNFMDYGPGHGNSFTFDQRTLMLSKIENAYWLPTNKNRNLRQSSTNVKNSEVAEYNITRCF